MAVLAIDQGTTSTRALRVADSGQVKITRVIKHRQFYPRPGWVEHDPEELIANILACIQASDAVNRIGIDNQGESCLAWHADTKRAICPVIVWQDNRSAAVIERLRRDQREAQVLETAGLPLDPYFSASKLGWILEHCPDAGMLLKQGKLRLGTTDAFFLDRLANHFVTDITTASRTSLMDLQTGCWDQGLCDLFKVPIETLPQIVPTTGDLGVITADGRQIPVTASVVDQQASLYGHGCRKTGDCKITFGTGAFALMVTGSKPVRSPGQGLLPTVAWQFDKLPCEYALDGGVYCAGSAVNWGRSIGLFESYSEINKFEKPPAIERELVFVPALSGLACPHWDRRAAGAWIGMSLDTDKRDLVQSILEGVALRAGEVIDAMSELRCIDDKISIDGGLSANPYFCQFLANALQKQVSVKSMAELTALGTAQLAGAQTVLQPGDEASECDYFPVKTSLGYHDRFKRAVQCAGHWRSV